MPRHDADRWELASERRRWPRHRGGLHAEEDDDDEPPRSFLSEGVSWAGVGLWFGLGIGLLCRLLLGCVAR
jgi:hypothetical protein